MFRAQEALKHSIKLLIKKWLKEKDSSEIADNTISALNSNYPFKANHTAERRYRVKKEVGQEFGRYQRRLMECL